MRFGLRSRGGLPGNSCASLVACWLLFSRANFASLSVNARIPKQRRDLVRTNSLALMSKFLRAVWNRSGRVGDTQPNNWRRLGVRLFAGIVLALATQTATAAEVKRVLVVHSFSSAAPPFTTHSLAFETELTARMGERVDLDEVSLDMARYADTEMQEALVDYLRRRQAKWQPDLVVPIGSPAGVFVARYRDRLFPRTPILYCGMDKRRLPPQALEQNAAFVGESFDLAGFVEDILQVAPATTNITVVIGATPLERYWTTAFREAYAQFTNRVNFTWCNDMSFDQMLEHAGKLPPRSYIFLVLLLRDASGVTHNADEALQRLHAVTTAPINGIFQHQLGLGIVGGRLYQAELEGVEAARVAIRILRGEPASSFPPKIIGPLGPRYDWRELRRWGISEKSLPPGSVVQFRETTIWDRYKWRIITVVSLCLAQALLILVLLANLVRRRRAERSLAESEVRFRIAADAAPMMIWMSGVDRRCTFFNQPWLEFTGRKLEQELGNGWVEGVHTADRETCLRTQAEAFDAQQPFVMEYRLRRHDGDYRWVSSAGRPRYDMRGNFTGFIGSCLDITERKQAEQTARELSGRLIHAQEAERARLARELHDDITQRLARLAIDAGLVERDTAGAARRETMQELRDGLVRLSEDVHSLSYRLHPALLEDLGLAEALKVECERFTRQHAIPAGVKMDEIPTRIPSDTALCVFRVTQEALRNVARHARANAAEVSLRRLDGGLQLAVVDNGVGFDAHHARHQGNLGLASMRERVRLVGGELDIESAPGRGTTILAWVPLSEEKI